MSRPRLQQLLPRAAFERFQVAQTKLRAIVDILGTSEYIFYQSHMRAYTSLISHILANNPEIIGYIELHRSYRHPADLVMMRQQIQTVSGAGLNRARYKLDKMLHNGNGVGDEIMRSPDVKSIFALRKPHETLPSIVAMVERTGEKVAYASIEGATEYYVQRVQRLAADATRAGSSIYFDAETVVDDTDRLLGRLSSFLGLRTPLESEYKTYSETGRVGSGDPSQNIHSGTVVRDRERAEIEVPLELLERAEAAYRSARHGLIQSCSVTVTLEGAPS